MGVNSVLVIQTQSVSKLGALSPGPPIPIVGRPTIGFMATIIRLVIKALS
jgi:hypothetical protein